MLLLPVTVMELGVSKSSVPTVFVTKFSLRLLKVAIITFGWSCPQMVILLLRGHTHTGHRCRCSCMLQDFSLHTLLCGHNRTYTLRQLNVTMNFSTLIYQEQMRCTRLLSYLNY